MNDLSLPVKLKKLPGPLLGQIYVQRVLSNIKKVKRKTDRAVTPVAEIIKT